MTVENVSNIGDLNATLPAAADPKSEGDDHLRNLKTALLNGFAGFTGAIKCTGADGGAANAYTLTPARALPGYGLRMAVVFAPTAANTGASTLNISGLGAKPLRSVTGAELAANDLVPGMIYAAFYNGSEFRLSSITKNYADQLVFSATLPAQAGNAGKALFTDGASAYWKAVGMVQRSPRTANAQLVAADLGSLIDITSGTFTQTFAAAATLGAGWYCYVRNIGTGYITIPASDGLANWIMYPGECRLFQCDGANFFSIILEGYSLTTQVSGTFIKPPGYSAHYVRGQGAGSGGGGGGGGASGGIPSGGTYYVGQPGSGGAAGTSGVPAEAVFLDEYVPASVPFTIGAGANGGSGGVGGAAVAAGISGNAGTNGNTGGTGNATTFGTAGTQCWLSAAGGTAGGTGGNGGTLTSAVQGGALGVTNSSTLAAIAGDSNCVTTYPATKGNGTNNGGSSGAQGSTSTPAGNGSNGGTSTTSIFSAVTVAGGVGGAGSTTVGLAGNNGSAPASQASPGCGGAGGGGGGGSAGPGSTNSSTAACGKGGDGAAGGKGGDGIIKISGIP